MGEELDDRELFKRLAKPGEQFNDDWIDALHEKVRDKGDLVAEKQWDSGNPGSGAGSVRVYAFQDLFFCRRRGLRHRWRLQNVLQRSRRLHVLRSQ